MQTDCIKCNPIQWDKSRHSFICPETISFGLIPKLQVSASLKLVGLPGTARLDH
jgi:hypothetical protein